MILSLKISSMKYPNKYTEHILNPLQNFKVNLNRIIEYNGKPPHKIIGVSQDNIGTYNTFISSYEVGTVNR